MMHVAVLGAGIMGCSAALCLARRGARVTLLDAAPRPCVGASRWNEGKIHLGVSVRRGSVAGHGAPPPRRRPRLQAPDRTAHRAIARAGDVTRRRHLSGAPTVGRRRRRHGALLRRRVRARARARRTRPAICVRRRRRRPTGCPRPSSRPCVTRRRSWPDSACRSARCRRSGSPIAWSTPSPLNHGSKAGGACASTGVRRPEDGARRPDARGHQRGPRRSLRLRRERAVGWPARRRRRPRPAAAVDLVAPLPAIALRAHVPSGDHAECRDWHRPVRGHQELQRPRPLPVVVPRGAGRRRDGRGAAAGAAAGRRRASRADRRRARAPRGGVPIGGRAAARDRVGPGRRGMGLRRRARRPRRPPVDVASPGSRRCLPRRPLPVDRHGQVPRSRRGSPIDWRPSSCPRRDLQLVRSATIGSTSVARRAGR